MFKKYDSLLEIYYGDEFICMLGSENCTSYDNVLWYEYKKLLDQIKDKDFSKEMFINYIDKEDGCFFTVNMKSVLYVRPIIDFKKKIISLPKCLVYKNIEEFNSIWEGKVRYLKKGNDYFVEYDYGTFELKKVYFDDVELLTKEFLTFEEFYKVFEFYDSIIDEYEVVLNDDKFIKFSILLKAK